MQRSCCHAKWQHLGAHPHAPVHEPRPQVRVRAGLYGCVCVGVGVCAGMVKLETRIPAGFLNGITALVPQVSGINIDVSLAPLLPGCLAGVARCAWPHRTRGMCLQL